MNQDGASTQHDGSSIQMEIYRQGADSGEHLPVKVEDWERLAKTLLEPGPYGYLCGGAGAEDTMRANAEAFYRWRIRPRVLRDVSERDLNVTLFGQQLRMPFLLAPIGVCSILHPDAELAVARAAAQTGMLMILSNMSTIPLERVAGELGETPRWFQIYPPKDRELTRSLVRRAEDAGYSAIVATLDSTLLGWRERDLHNGYLPFLTGQGLGNYLSDPVFCARLEVPLEQDRKAAIQRALDEGNNTAMTWADIDFLRSVTRVPLLLKGLTHPEDATLALDHGADGLVVSNHGGRQLDGAIATLDALPAICEVVHGRVPVLMDGGIRRGADVIKALALGATAVLIGRPWAYGLAVAGAEGVQKVIENIIADVDLHLAISGHRSVRELNPSLLVRAEN